MPRFTRPTALAAASILAVGLTAGVGVAHAADFTAVGDLTQPQFRAFSREIAAATAHRALIPAEPLGILGFDVGVALHSSQVDDREALRAAAAGRSVPSHLPMASVRAAIGLPFSLDVGVNATTIPGSNVRSTGADLRWAFVPGSTLVPAVAVRLGVARVSGVDGYELDSQSVDVSISKGFTLLTPYAGVGYVQSRARAPGSALASTSFGQGKVFAGVNIAFVPFALLLEADRTGDNTGFGAKFAIRF
jgi:hypothetical protein